MKGFFYNTETNFKKSIPLLPQCGSCGLWKGCLSPKMPVAGQGLRKILVIAESPGKDEDQQNRPLVGRTGQRFQRTIADYGIDLFRDCWVTNSARCRPHLNQLPEKAIEYCRPYVIQAVQELKPETIILLGAKAVKSLVGWLWKEDTGQFQRWTGWRIPVQKINCWVCPTYHPSYIERAEDDQDKNYELLERFWRQHLKAAFSKQGRPWKTVPDWESSVRIVMDDSEAADMILEMCKSSVPVAWDIEADRLKPDMPESEVVTCSLSDGTTTFAFPWYGQAIKAMREFLQSDVSKIASNLKYEHRWMLRHMKLSVRKWEWDTMLAAHVLDNRPGLSSIKFQAFVRLGVDSWDSHITPYFKADNSNSKNRIKEISLPNLLKYNALDSLYEWKVSKIQKRKMGYDVHG